jgi:hypothetical protein
MMRIPRFGLDRRVEREQVRLRCDAADQRREVVHGGRRFLQLANLGGRAVGHLRRFPQCEHGIRQLGARVVRRRSDLAASGTRCGDGRLDCSTSAAQSTHRLRRRAQSLELRRRTLRDVGDAARHVARRVGHARRIRRELIGGRRHVLRLELHVRHERAESFARAAQRDGELPCGLARRLAVRTAPRSPGARCRSEPVRCEHFASTTSTLLSAEKAKPPSMRGLPRWAVLGSNQ